MSLRIISLLICFFLLLGLTASAQCSGTTANIPAAGTVTINGVQVTTTSSGSVSNFPFPFTSCTGAATATTSAGSLHVGLSGTFTVNFTFDQPVNDLMFVLNATGEVVNENFVFNTNGGTPSIADNGSCFSTIVGNEVLSGAGSLSGGGGGHFTVTAPASFTTLTLTGDGGTNGSLLAICVGTITPVCGSIGFFR